MNPRTCKAHGNSEILHYEAEVSETVEKPSEKNDKIPLPTCGYVVRDTVVIGGDCVAAWGGKLWR